MTSSVRWRWAFVVVALTFLAGCSHSDTLHFPHSHLGLSLAPLERDQYRFLGDTVGEACAEYYGFWPLPLFYVRTPDGKAVIWFSFDDGSVARSQAFFAALNRLGSRADFLVAPRVLDKHESKFIWWSETCVTVQAKAVGLVIGTGAERQMAPEEPRDDPAAPDVPELEDATLP